MKEGALFATLEQLEQEIKEYEATNYVTLQKRDSCLLSKAVKKYPRAARGNRNLKYYYVEYTCSKGGKRFKSRGKAIRKSSTMYEGCPMKIKFVLAEDGKHLLCKLLHDQHNHIRNKVGTYLIKATCYVDLLHKMLPLLGTYNTACKKNWVVHRISNTNSANIDLSI
ncbi:hypothetical protein PPYR_03927 [Photinus pyralis]|uniref:ZSWIM3 N-terminal domain-containing protein n=1 Tax=Photinus pyralis TaxID=7054 RepID=A0A5N4AWM4_PHOPY|nr:hypothetical protein PPYR_03927 [Photinus pyralis]